MNENTKKYVFVGKTLFFPKEKILVIGDLHLGYEESLRQKGLEMPLGQFEEMQAELEKTLNYIKARYGSMGELRIIFLGDVKHHFGYLASEKNDVKELLSFLRKKGVDENRVIFVRGNHEKNDKSGKYADYYIVKDIAFIHGNREFLEVYSGDINLVVMGHLHPTVTLSDEMKVKREKYKCFLAGKFKNKNFVVVPSFLSITEGVSANEFDDERAGGYDFSVIPQKELENFKVFVAADLGEEAMNFGRLKEL